MVQDLQNRTQNQSKMGSESHLRRGGPQKASGEPLGALLEALGAEKKKLGTALGRFGAKKGAKMVTQKITTRQAFWGSKLGSKIGPPFCCFPRTFLSLPREFSSLRKSIVCSMDSHGSPMEMIASE